MASPGGVVFNFIAKTADATRDIGKLDGALGGLSKGAKKASGGIGSVLAGVGKAVPFVGAAVVGVAAGFGAMAKAAYDDANAQAKLERNLKRIPGVTKKSAAATGKWIDQMELATLVADDDLRVALGKLAFATDDVRKAQKLAALAQDAAVGSGKNFLGVAEALAKAAEGNTTALKRQFPWLDAGKDKVLTLAEATQQLTDKYGGAAKAAADKDVFGRIRVAFGQIGEAIGTAALPLLEDLSDWFGDEKNSTKIEEWIGKLQTWAETIGTDVKDKLTEFVTWLQSQDGKDAIEDFSNAVEGIGDAFKWALDRVDDFLTGLDAVKKWMEENPSFTRGDPKADPGKTWPKLPGGTDTAGLHGGGTVVNIYNPKPERGSASVAAALRVTRPNTVSI